MRTIFRTVSAPILAVIALLTLAVLPAAAKPIGPSVTADYEHGTLTTPCFVHKGEVLKGLGYAAGTFTVTSVKAHGPVYLVKLSPAPVPVTEPPQASLVLVFTVVG